MCLKFITVRLHLTYLIMRSKFVTVRLQLTYLIMRSKFITERRHLIMFWCLYCWLAISGHWWIWISYLFNPRRIFYQRLWSCILFLTCHLDYYLGIKIVFWVEKTFSTAGEIKAIPIKRISPSSLYNTLISEYN